MANRNFSRGSIDQMIDAFENRIAELEGQPDIVDSCDAITAAYRDDVIEDEDGEMLEEDGAVQGDGYIESLVAAVDAQLEESNNLDSWTWEYDQDKENIHLTTVSDEDILEYTIPMADLSQTDEGVETDVDYIMAAVMGEEDNEDIELDEEDEDVLSSTMLEDDEYVERSEQYYVYDDMGVVVGEQFEYLEDAIEFAEQNGYASVDVHRYGRDGSGRLHLDGDAETVWTADGQQEESYDSVESSSSIELLPGDEEIVYSDPEGMFGEGCDLSFAEIKDYWNNNCQTDPVLSQYGSFDDWWKDTKTWLPQCSDVVSSTTVEGAGEYDKWEELMTKQVPDADGFYTDYTLYHNPFTDEYICMFGDKDIYTPDVNSADWEGYTEEEAIEWFNSYEGLDDDQYIESSENIEGAFGDKKKKQIKEIMEQAFGDYRWQTPEVVARGVANQIRSALVEIGQVCTSESWVRIGKKLTKLPKEIESRKPSLQSVIREMIKIAENAAGADVDTDELEDIRNRLSKLERSGSLGEKIVKQIDKQSWKSIPSVMRDAMKQAFRDFNGDYRNDM